MKISVLVPVYNAGKYIDRCARSLFRQTYNEIEFVFVNDCTPDNSIEILRQVLEEYPSRQSQTKIISHDSNRGVAAARNTLLDNAVGDYVLWVDADDFIEGNAVEILVAKAEATGADIVCFNTAWYTKASGIRMMPENSSSTPVDFIQDVMNGKISPVLWGRLMRLSLFREHNVKFVEGLNMGEDLMVLIEAAYYANAIANEKSLLYYQEVGNYDSLSRSYSPKSVDVTLNILDRIEKFFIGKFDISIGLNKRKLECYLRKMYLLCIDGDKAKFMALRSEVRLLVVSGIRPKENTPYALYMFCNNYVLCRMYSYLILWGRSLYRKIFILIK